MAFYYHSNYYQYEPPSDDQDRFSSNSSYNFDSNYSINSDNAFLESQFFGSDLNRPNYIDEDSQFIGARYGYDQPPPYYYHLDAASYYAYSPIQPTIAYSASPLYESKSFEIDPNDGNPRDHYATRFIVSYSTVEFNEPEFEEYDPTPYGGGYDPSSTYGKPLPPSAEICYPKDSAEDDAKVQSPSGVAIPEEIDTAGSHKGTDHGEGVATPEEIDTTGSSKGTDHEEEELTENHEDPKPLIPVVEVKRHGDHGDGDVYADRPQDGSLDGYNKMFPPAPPGFGLDSLDLCESLFGHWPCLAREARRGCCCPHEYGHGGRWIQWNEWEGAANYLFGNPDPYKGSNGGRHDDHGVGDFSSFSVHSQERHY